MIKKELERELRRVLAHYSEITSVQRWQVLHTLAQEFEEPASIFAIAGYLEGQAKGASNPAWAVAALRVAAAIRDGRIR